MWGKREDMLVHEREPFNAEPGRAALGRSPLTPVDTFYSRNHGPVPDLDPETWRLTVDGLVGTELSLSLADLRTRFERHELVATLQCAGNRRTGLLAVRDIPNEAPWDGGATGTASWAGVRLCDVLAEAGVPRRRRPRRVPGPRPRRGRPARAAVRRLRPGRQGAGTRGAAGLGDERRAPHEPARGPVRVVVPGWIGARSVKWVERVHVRADPSENYFQATAYRLLSGRRPGRAGRGTSLGPVALNTEILHPEPGAEVAAGRSRSAATRSPATTGTSSGSTCRLDGGTTWSQADLGDDQGPWAWRLWRLTSGSPSAGPGSWPARGTAPERRSRRARPRLEPEGLRQQLVGRRHRPRGIRWTWWPTVRRCPRCSDLLPADRVVDDPGVLSSYSPRRGRVGGVRRARRARATADHRRGPGRGARLRGAPGPPSSPAAPAPACPAAPTPSTAASCCPPRR